MLAGIVLTAHAQYDYTVIATTGQSGLTGIKSAPSINVFGQVAFIGLPSGGESIFVGDGVSLANISPNFSSSYTFSTFFQLGNNRRVVARDSRGGIFYIRSWDIRNPDNYAISDWTSGISVSYCGGGLNAGKPCMTAFDCPYIDVYGNVIYYPCGHTPSTPFTSLLFPSMNNTGQVVYVGIQPGPTSTNLLVTSGPLGQHQSRISSGSMNFHPIIADNGLIVGRAGNSGISPIRLYSADLSVSNDIASTADGFRQLGQYPAISEDGAAVAFTGDRGNGQGVFLSLAVDSGRPANRIIIKAIGENISLAGSSSELGTNCAGGSLNFSSIVVDSPLGVTHVSKGAPGLADDTVLVCFIGTPNSKSDSCTPTRYPFSNSKGLWVARLDIDATNQARLVGILPVAQVGGTVGGVSVNDVSIQDPIAKVVDNQGNIKEVSGWDHQVAFMASTPSGPVIVRANWTPGPDLLTNALAWGAQGGVDFQYEVKNHALTNATTAKLFWATGVTTNDIIQTAPLIFTNDIPIGTATGTSMVINVPASQFTNPPAGATHVLLSLDYDNLVQEAEEGNNVAALGLQEFLDAMTFQHGGVLPADASQYLSVGQTRLGAVADGASRLVVRFHTGSIDLTDPTLNLHFTISGAGSQGQLRAIASDTWSSDVPATIVPLCRKALCIFESPMDYPASAPTGAVQLLNGSTLIASKEIGLKRPPVVLVHGIWSSGQEAWGDISGAKRYIEQQVGPNQDGFPVMLADYGRSNAREFDYNAPLVFGFIEQAIQGCHPDYACSQADVVGHSMGALLARLAAQRWGKQHANYEMGNIHKLISIGTPHQGSFLADRLALASRDTPVRYLDIASLLALMGKYVNRGAAGNLSAYLGYTDLFSVHQTPIPSHAIVCNCDYPVGLSDDLRKLYIVLGILLPQYSDPRCATSDAVVEMTSQAGGLSGGAVTRFLSTAQHTSETSSQAVQANVFRLLDAPVVSSGWFDMKGFTFFPGINIPPPGTANVHAKAWAADSANDTVGDWLVVSGLADSQTVHPGDTIVGNVLAVDNRPIQSFTLLGGTNVIELTSEPFNFQFIIPSAAIGNLPLMAIATDLNGQPSVQFITLRVQSSASLISISVDPPLLQMSAEKNWQLHVFGTFSDSITRDITATSAGTTYASSDEQRVLVDTNGVVNALQNTTAPVTISVSNGGITANLEVTVDLMNLPPTAVISSNLTNTRPHTPLSIQFDASQSSDPESSPLTYFWDFGDGSISNQQTPPPHTFSSPGDYVVKLVVFDSQGLEGRSELPVNVTSPVFLAIQYLSGIPLVTVFGESGVPYVVEGSTNRQNWIPVTTNAAINSNSFEFLDRSAGNSRQRFYRARKP